MASTTPTATTPTATITTSTTPTATTTSTYSTATTMPTAAEAPNSAAIFRPASQIVNIGIASAGDRDWANKIDLVLFMRSRYDPAITAWIINIGVRFATGDGDIMHYRETPFLHILRQNITSGTNTIIDSVKINEDVNPFDDHAIEFIISGTIANVPFETTWHIDDSLDGNYGDFVIIPRSIDSSPKTIRRGTSFGYVNDDSPITFNQ
jgi:hypothetical protein